MSIGIDRVLAALPTTERGQATQISCDAKGQRIAYASAKSVFLRNIDDPAQSKQYAGHTFPTTVARFSPSGFYVASGDTSGHVRVWDAVEAVTTKGDYQPIAGRINDISWDGDSQRLIAVGAGQKRYGHAFTADSGNSIGEITGHSKTVNAVALRQQRPLRAATVGDDGAMCFLHGVPFKFNTKVADAHAGFVLNAAYSPDGATLATVGADRRIRLYDGKTGEPVRHIGDGVHTGSIFAVAWAPDSRRLATASADQTVRVWDVDAGMCLHTWRVGPDEASVSVPDQQVGVAWPPGRSDDLIIGLSLSGDLSYFVPGKERRVRVVQGHNKTITALCASSGDGGRAVSTGSFDGRVCSWDVATGVGRVVDGQTHSNQVTHFAAAQGRLYSVGWDDHLRTVDEAAATFTGSSAPLGAQPRRVAAATGGYVVVAFEAALAVYKDDKRVGSMELGFTPTALAAATGGSLVAVGSGGDHGNAIELFDLGGDGTLSPSKTSKPPPAQAPVSALALTADGGMLAAGIRTGKIAAYRRAEGDASFAVVTERWSAHSAQVTSLAWNSAGTQVVSGSLDTHVFVWSLADPGQRVQAANAHQGGVNGVAWVDGGAKVASGGFDGAVKIWTVKGLK